jgi:hypothetical protein
MSYINGIVKAIPISASKNWPADLFNIEKYLYQSAGGNII